MKELYENLRRIEMERVPNAYIPSFEEAKGAIRQAYIDNNSLDDWIICMKAEEALGTDDAYIPMCLFELVVKELRAVQ